MFQPRKLVLPIFALLGLGLAACASAGGVESTPPVATAGLGSLSQPSLAPTGTVVVTPMAANPAPTAATVPEDQHATDPTTVDLASGRPTLVKFFAFW